MSTFMHSAVSFGTPERCPRQAWEAAIGPISLHNAIGPQRPPKPRGPYRAPPQGGQFRQPLGEVGGAQPVSLLPRYPGAFFEQHSPPLEVAPSEFGHAQNEEGHGGTPTVAKLPAQSQTLFELRHRGVKVALTYGGGSPDYT